MSENMWKEFVKMRKQHKILFQTNSKSIIFFILSHLFYIYCQITRQCNNKDISYNCLLNSGHVVESWSQDQKHERKNLQVGKQCIERLLENLFSSILQVSEMVSFIDQSRVIGRLQLIIQMKQLQHKEVLKNTKGSEG